MLIGACVWRVVCVSCLCLCVCVDLTVIPDVEDENVADAVNPSSAAAPDVRTHTIQSIAELDSALPLSGSGGSSVFSTGAAAGGVGSAAGHDGRGRGHGGESGVSASASASVGGSGGGSGSGSGGDGSEIDFSLLLSVLSSVECVGVDVEGGVWDVDSLLSEVMSEMNSEEGRDGGGNGDGEGDDEDGDKDSNSPRNSATTTTKTAAIAKSDRRASGGAMAAK